MSSLDANRFPERMYPGEFDSIGLTSHAIWHVFVCFGIFVSESSFNLSL
jgi:adiponectin receptor